APPSRAPRARGAVGGAARNPCEDRPRTEEGARGHRVRRPRGPRADLPGDGRRRVLTVRRTPRIGTSSTGPRPIHRLSTSLFPNLWAAADAPGDGALAHLPSLTGGK